MQEELVQIIHESINETVIAFFQDDIGIVPDQTVIKDTNDTYQSPQEDVTAIVSFSGDMSGGIHMSASKHVAFGIASAFTGVKFTGFNDHCIDAIGELVNIIAGSIKERLRPNIYLTPPNVVIGEYHDVEYMDRLNSAKCYFKSNDGLFFFEVFYKETATKVVDKLREELDEIINALINFKSVGIKTKEGREVFLQIEKLYTSHLREIEEQIYPVLRKSADEELDRILSMVNEETTRICEFIVDFSNKLSNIAEQEEDYFDERFAFIVKLLETSFQLEEEIIFEQYFEVFEEPEE